MSYFSAFRTYLSSKIVHSLSLYSFHRKCQATGFVVPLPSFLLTVPPLRMGSPGTKRLQREYEDMLKGGNPSFRNIVQPNDSNFFVWQGLVVPENPPYNKGAFKIELTFPQEYPFKPPKLTFLTQIYHPNIDEKGQVCLPIIASENWKPATRTTQVIDSLVALVNDPEPEHPLRADLAQELQNDKKKFFKTAEEFTKKHAEKRPSD